MRRHIFHSGSRLYFKNFIGKTQKVLVEKGSDEQGRLCGVTPHYVPVRFAGGDRLRGHEVEIQLVEIDQFAGEDFMLGRVV